MQLTRTFLAAAHIDSVYYRHPSAPIHEIRHTTAMPYAAILFDMDGTLLETGPLWNQATRQAVAEHDIFLTEQEHNSLAWRLLHDVLAEKGYSKEVIQAVRAARDNALLPILRAEAVWRGGAQEFLASLTLPTGIITNTHTYVLNVIDEVLSIRDSVGTVVVGDDVRPDFKPHPKGLLLACQQLNVDSKACVYIGDQQCDLDAAKNAGMDAILIRGTHTPSDLMHDKIAANFAELRKMLA